MTDKAVEAAAKAIKAELGCQWNAAPMPGPNLPDSDDWTATGGMIDLNAIAKAAIDAYLAVKREEAPGHVAFLRQIADELASLGELYNAMGAREAADALEALQGWQDISTAPKDGTQIHVAKAGCPHVWKAHWEKMKRVPDRWASFAGLVPFKPTHWQPLPAPPEDHTDETH